LKPFGIQSTPGGHVEAHSEEELKLLVAASGESGVLNANEVQLAGRILNFADRAVSEIMVPRVKMSVLDLNESFEKNLRFAMDEGFSRYPLVIGGRDEVHGIVHVMDMYKSELEGRRDLAALSRPAHRIPTSKKLDALLRDFQRESVHMALVTDEYGGTDGLVTLEDVIEQIVGSISDEHDAE
jgi:CBS domain containing-hemolysin-like protein